MRYRRSACNQPRSAGDAVPTVSCRRFHADGFMPTVRTPPRVRGLAAGLASAGRRLCRPAGEEERGRRRIVDGEGRRSSAERRAPAEDEECTGERKGAS